jgi:hypothetical protein
MLECVVYRPNKGSGFGQAFRARRVREAAASLERFLISCTTYSGPVNLQLKAYRATEWDDDFVADSAIARVSETFGPVHAEESLGQKWPSGEKLKGGTLIWELKSEELPYLVDFVASSEPWPKQTLGPVEIHASYSFQWTDPDTGTVLPGQDSGNATADGRIRSSLLISLGRSQFAQPDFWFPFPEGAPKLSSFLHRVAGLIPFRLNSRHFRAAIPNRDGSGYSFRKIVLPPDAV